MVFMETPILIAMTKAMTCLVWHHVTHEVTHDAQKRPSSAAPLGFASSPGATAVGTASEFFSLSERATEVLNWFDFLIFQSWGLYPLGRFWEKNIRVYILIMSPFFYAQFLARHRLQRRHGAPQLAAPGSASWVRDRPWCRGGAVGTGIHDI